jgi:hypothetical protein
MSSLDEMTGLPKAAARRKRYGFPEGSRANGRLNRFPETGQVAAIADGAGKLFCRTFGRTETLAMSESRWCRTSSRARRLHRLDSFLHAVLSSSSASIPAGSPDGICWPVPINPSFMPPRLRSAYQVNKSSRFQIYFKLTTSPSPVGPIEAYH